MSFFKDKLRNSNGTSMMEMITAMGLTSILLLGIASMLRQNKNNSRKVDANNTVSQELNSLVEVLGLVGDDLRSDLYDTQETYFTNENIYVSSKAVLDGKFDRKISLKRDKIDDKNKNAKRSSRKISWDEKWDKKKKEREEKDKEKKEKDKERKDHGGRRDFDDVDRHSRSRSDSNEMRRNNDSQSINSNWNQMRRNSNRSRVITNQNSNSINSPIRRRRRN